jgi:uracil-DNA glycosylase
VVCKGSLPFGPRPVVQLGSLARLLIIGQAPGRRVHESGVPWEDASGARLREWIGIDEAAFYDPTRVALMPWHGRLREHMPKVGLTLLVGLHAQKAYLTALPARTLTETVRNFERCPPGFLPLPHPSWRSTGWMRRNPWFGTEVLPKLRARVAAALGEAAVVGTGAVAETRRP